MKEHANLLPAVVGAGAAGPDPVSRLTREGGIDLRCEDDGQTLAWSFANEYYRIGLDDAVAALEDENAVPTPEPTPEIVTIDLTTERHVPRGTVALRGGRAVTMRGEEEVIDNATIVVTDNRITAIGPRATSTSPRKLASST